MKITGLSKIEFHKLHPSSQPNEQNLYKLTRVDTDERILVDKNLVALVRELHKGVTVQQAAQEIKFSLHTGLMMIKILEDAHFLKSIDGVPVDNSGKKSKLVITGHSTIEFYKLRMSTQSDEHNLYGVVRWDTDDTLKVDKNVVALIKHLNEGKTVQEAAHEIAFSVDVVLLLMKMLEESHFFKTVDGEPVEDSGEKIKPWLTHVDRKWFRWIIYKPLIYIVLFFSIVGIAAGFFTYGIPSYKSFFWTSDLLVVLFSFFLADMFFLFTHEFTHFCVTKAVGGEAVMRIGYRYIYLVAETESYHLGVVTKKQRYLVYLSGSIMDLLIVGLIYWFLLATRVLGFTIGQGYNFLIAIILLELIAVIWQFDAFLETDMYNFLSEYLGIENLRNDALKYISLHTKKWKKILFFPIKRLLLFFAKDYTVSSDDLRLLNKSDKRKLFIYVLFLIAGIVFTTLEYIFYTIPALFTFISTVSTDIIRTTQHFDLISLTKSSLVMVLITYQYFLLLYLRIRKKKTS